MTFSSVIITLLAISYKEKQKMAGVEEMLDLIRIAVSTFA
jgi:hypothetical protein